MKPNKSGLLPSPNGRYFVDAAGDPAFWLGDTQWELFRLYTPDEAMEILTSRKTKGFNVILIMLMGVGSTALTADDAPSHVNLHGEAPWLDGDPSRPNEEYFRHVDEMIALGQETGQIFVVGIYHQWNLETITVAKAGPWAKWVAERYRDVPGLIWSMYPKATDEYKPVCRELAAGLIEGDGGAHLISVHPDPSVASSSFIHDETWLSYNMIQTCVDYDKIHEAVSADYSRTPVKPVVMAEGGYEGVEFEKLQTPHDIRKQAYWTQLAGGHHIYGHTEEWTAPREWKRWLESDGACDMERFRRIITSLAEWWDMVPDQTLFAEGIGNGYSLNVAARSATGKWIVAYLSESATVSLHLDTLGRSVKVEWINPASDERIPAEIRAAETQTAGTPTAETDAAFTFTPPAGWADAVLVVTPG